MSDRQFDLFAGAGLRPDVTAPIIAERSRLTPTTLDDNALIGAIPLASLVDCHDLAAEAGRRRLTTAIPALAALCRRFKGFGTESAVPEQTAALDGLAAIGNREAADTVARMVSEQVVQGPGLAHAVAVAAGMGARLPRDLVLSLLRHPSPAVRANACRLCRPWPDAVALLIDLLDDLSAAVTVAAACALGRMGQVESRPALIRLLRECPSEEVIEAIAGVADEECLVLLGRVARTKFELTGAVLTVLDEMDNPRAAVIAAGVRRSSA
jgi:hypothetical protein